MTVESSKEGGPGVSATGARARRAAAAAACYSLGYIVRPPNLLVVEVALQPLLLGLDGKGACARARMRKPARRGGEGAGGGGTKYGAAALARAQRAPSAALAMALVPHIRCQSEALCAARSSGARRRAAARARATAAGGARSPRQRQHRTLLGWLLLYHPLPTLLHLWRLPMAIGRLFLLHLLVRLEQRLLRHPVNPNCLDST